MKSTHQTLTSFFSQLSLVTLFLLGGNSFAYAQQTVTITLGGTATAPTTTVTNTKLPAALQITNVVLKGDGTTDHPFEIGSVAEWTAFATIANDPNQVYANAKLTADITFSGNHLQPGENSNWSYTHQPRIYRDTFDGQGHTITLNQQTLGGSGGTSPTYGGLFWHVGGATIKNLRVAGKIETKNSMSGAFIQNVNSTVLQPVTIENCISSVNNHWAGTDNTNYGYFGSFVGDVHHDMTLNIKNCLMDGQFTTNNYTIGHSGGFVGITSTQENNQASTINIKNSYFHPENIDNNYINFSYFCNSVASSGERDVHLNISQSYYSLPSTYTGTGQVAQGTAAPAAVADLLAGLNTNAEKVNDEDPWIVHNDTVYLATFAKYVDIQDVPYGSSPTPTIVGNSGNATVTYKYKTQGAADNTYATYTPGTTILPLGDYTIKAIVPAANGWNAWESTMNFSVVKAEGTVTAAPTAVTTTLTYDGSEQTLLATAGTATGTFNYRIGDTGEWATTLPKATNAGSYNIYYYVTPDGNHTAIDDFGSAESPKGPIAVTINKVGLIVTANNHSITYGDSPANNGVEYSGFVNSETAAVLGGTLAYNYNYAQYGDVGNTYTITPSGLTSSNYDISFVAGTLTVGQKEVGLTWSTPTTFTYDGEEHAPTATATGLVNSDEIGVTVTGAQTNANASAYTATATALTGTKSGNYKLPATGTTQTFTINPATGAISAAPTAASPTYNGSAQALLATNGTATFTGTFYYREGTSGEWLTTPPTKTDADTYNIYYYVASDGNHTAVGSTSSPLGPIEVTIGKVPLTVTANNHSITYGDGPANNGVAFSGFVNSETSAVLSGTLAYNYNYAQYGDVGNTYTITPSGLTSSNYDISFVAGTLTVGQKEVGLTWSTPTSFTYDGEEHAPTATATGLVNSDEIGVTVTGAQTNANTSPYTATASALNGTKSGNYKLPAATTQNYVINAATLNAATLNSKISLNNNSFTYTGAAQAPAVTIKGMTEGTDFTVKYKKDGGSSVAEKPKDTGTYTIVIVGKGNYSGEVVTNKTFVIQEPTPEPEPEPETPKVVDSSKPMTIGGETFYELTSDIQKSIESNFKTGIVLPAAADTRTTVTSEAALSFSKGTDIMMAVRNLKLSDIVTFIFTGNLYGDSSRLRQIGAAARGTRGDSALKLASGVAYEVISAGDMIVSIKLGDEESTIKSINVKASATGINAVETDNGKDLWFDLNGQRIDKPTKKGIYIKNGQKVVVNP